MGEDPQAEAVHHPLTRNLHGINLEEIQSEISDQDEDDEQSDVKNACHILPSQDQEILLLQFLHPFKRNIPMRTTPLKNRRILS